MRDVIRRHLLAFALANAVALALTFIAISQAWIADVDEVPRILVTRWLPFALVLATLLTAAIAFHSATQICHRIWMTAITICT